MRNCDASGSPFLNGTFLEKIAQVAFGLPLRGKLLLPNTWFATALPPQNAQREQITVLLITKSECKDDQSIMVAFFSFRAIYAPELSAKRNYGNLISNQTI